MLATLLLAPGKKGKRRELKEIIPFPFWKKKKRSGAVLLTGRGKMGFSTSGEGRGEKI